jgi:hypothetical protein
MHCSRLSQGAYKKARGLNPQCHRYRLRLRGTGAAGNPSAKRRKAGGSAGGGADYCSKAGGLPVAAQLRRLT